MRNLLILAILTLFSCKEGYYFTVEQCPWIERKDEIFAVKNQVIAKANFEPTNVTASLDGSMEGVESVSIEGFQVVINVYAEKEAKERLRTVTAYATAPDQTNLACICQFPL